MRHPTKHLRFFLASVLAAGLLAGPAAFGGTAYAQAANGGPAAEKAGAVGKVGFALTALSNEYHAFVNRNGNDAGFAPSNSLLPVVGGKVVIDAAANGDARALERALMALGLQNSAVAGRLVSGRLPFRSIRAAGALAGLRFARPAYAATRVGLVTSEADYVMHSDFARLLPPDGAGVDGDGQTVGVLSDSYDRSASASTNAEQDIISEDLPPAARIKILDDPACSGCIDEGRAMMQLIHDIAPGANLAFHTAFTGQAGFAQGIKDLAAAGANIIVDDVIYFHEPMFQDGVIAQAVDHVVAGGVAYFSAAGNDARDGYEEVFDPGDTFAARAFKSARLAPRFFGGIAHDFDTDDFETGSTESFQTITIPAKRTVYFSVQWQQPFSSACENCPGATTDMDVYLLNSANKVVAGGISNNLGGDPVEVFGVSNGGNTPAVVKLIIVKFDDTHPDPGMIKYVAFGNPSIDTFDTASGTVYGHAGAVGAEAVGAAFYRTPDELESFSSAGPVRILFNESGAGILEETRFKPEIVAPDGTNTTFFYADTSLDLDEYPNFFGTSAAAPHAAGVAALLRQYNGSLTPAQIYALLEDSAIDITKREGGITLVGVDPDSNLGRDDDSGYGLIQADLALSLNAPNNAPVVTITSPAGDDITVAEGDTVVFAVDVSDVEDNDTLLTADIVWTSNLDGDIGDGAGFSTSSLSVNVHTITASVSDSDASPGSDSVQVTVTGGGGGGGGGGGYMHVGDLDDGGSELSGRNLNKWTAKVTITVHGALEALVKAASVSGIWSDGARGGGSCITDDFGQCTVSKGNLKLDALSATFTVTDVTHELLTYVSTDNHDPNDVEPAITVDQPLP